MKYYSLFSDDVCVNWNRDYTDECESQGIVLRHDSRDPIYLNIKGCYLLGIVDILYVIPITYINKDGIHLI